VHIVQALVSLNLGGSELVAVELAEFAIRQGHRVTMIAADGPLGSRVRRAGIEHLDWPIGDKRLGTLKYISKLAKWARAEMPDIVHVHSRLPAWITHMARHRTLGAERPPWITSMHGHYSVSRYSGIMARGDRVICVSNHVRDYTVRNYPGVDPSRISVIHGGVCDQEFPFGYRPGQDWFETSYREFPQLKDRRLLCLPGRLTRWKRHPEFIHLIARLSRQLSDIHGVIVGDGRPGSGYRHDLEALTRKLGIVDQVTFVGPRTDIRNWMAASEIVYNLSNSPPEAFGRTVPEALYLGVPVIAWNHGGVSETLASLFPGGAVAPGDDKALLEKSLAFLEARPSVPKPNAFRLDESMHATMAVYMDAVRTG